MTSTTDSPPATLLKTDTLGRIRTPAEEREAFLDAFERSGMSGAAFCRTHGLRYPTFASWRQRRKRERQEAAEQADGSPLFEEVDLSVPQRPQEALCLELPGGAQCRLTHTDHLPMAAALLRYLEGTGHRSERHEC